MKSLLEQVSAEDLQLRFFAVIKYFGLTLVRLSHFGDAHAMAFDESTFVLVGVVAFNAASHNSGKYAVVSIYSLIVWRVSGGRHCACFKNFSDKPSN